MITSNPLVQANQSANVPVNKRLLDALRLTVRPLIRLGDFVGNVDKGGASHLGEFDRCAIVLEVRNAIEVAEKLFEQAPVPELSPAADGRLKFRVLGAHPDGTFFDIEVEACDGQSAFGAAAVLLHEADEDGDAQFYAAIPAGTDVTLPGEGVVTLGTVLDPEQADVFGLDAIQNVVADVLQRASEDGFTPDEITVPDAVTECANVLSIELSDAEIALASQRILDAQGGVESAKETRSVALAETTFTFSLPDDFGMGWEYTNVRLYGQHHAWAGSYDKSESGNFAHEALMQLPEVTSAYLQVGLTCNVDVKVNAIAEAATIQSRLQAVVDAFAVRPERQIGVRGSNFYDSQVTEHDANDPDIEVVSDMPYLSYLAKCVPLAESLPALSGHDLAALRAQADDHQRAKKVVKDDSPSPGV